MCPRAGSRHNLDHVKTIHRTASRNKLAHKLPVIAHALYVRVHAQTRTCCEGLALSTFACQSRLLAYGIQTRGEGGKGVGKGIIIAAIK